MSLRELRRGGASAVVVAKNVMYNAGTKSNKESKKVSLFQQIRSTTGYNASSSGRLQQLMSSFASPIRCSIPEHHDRAGKGRHSRNNKSRACKHERVMMITSTIYTTGALRLKASKEY